MEREKALKILQSETGSFEEDSRLREDILDAMIEYAEMKTLKVKSFPTDEELKTHISKLPYYGSCTIEYNEGFEDGVKWLLSVFKIV